MGLTAGARNVMLGAITALITHESLHTADPGGSGTSEVSGGSPAYARKAVTWNAASGGSVTASNAPVFDVPASTTITHVGFWSAATAGTFYGSADITDEVFAGQGTYTVSTTTITAS